MTIRWASDRASAGSPGGAGRRGERGATSAEYLGIIVIVGGIVAAVAGAGVGGQVSSGLAAAICRITGGQCQAPSVAPQALPKCETSTYAQKVGLSATVFSVKGSDDNKYTVTRYGDGTAKVETENTYGLGAEGSFGEKVELPAILGAITGSGSSAEKAGGKNGAYGAVSGMVIGGVHAVYEFDNAQEADAWAADNRNVITQVTSVLGGPTADAVMAATDWVKTQFGMNHARTPDAISFQVGSQAQGEVGVGAPYLAGAAADASLEGTGTVEVNLHDGTAEFTGAASGSLGASLDSALFSAGGDASAVGSYTVSYDAQGNPTKLTVTGEGNTSGNLSAGLPGIPTKAGKIGGSGEGSAGTKKKLSWTLDLTDPANRAAFDNTFVTAGPVSLPKPDAARLPLAVMDLADRLNKDAVYVESTYSTAGVDYSASVEGGDGLSFGVGGGYSSESSTLTGASVKDNRVPGSTLQPLTTCQGG